MMATTDTPTRRRIVANLKYGAVAILAVLGGQLGAAAALLACWPLDWLLPDIAHAAIAIPACLVGALYVAGATLRWLLSRLDHPLPDDTARAAMPARASPMPDDGSAGGSGGSGAVAHTE